MKGHILDHYRWGMVEDNSVRAPYPDVFMGLEVLVKGGWTGYGKWR